MCLCCSARPAEHWPPAPARRAPPALRGQIDSHSPSAERAGRVEGGRVQAGHVCAGGGVQVAVAVVGRDSIWGGTSTSDCCEPELRPMERDELTIWLGLAVQNSTPKHCCRVCSSSSEVYSRGEYYRDRGRAWAVVWRRQLTAWPWPLNSSQAHPRINGYANQPRLLPAPSPLAPHNLQISLLTIVPLLQALTW